MIKLEKKTIILDIIMRLHTKKLLPEPLLYIIMDRWMFIFNELDYSKVFYDIEISYIFIKHNIKNFRIEYCTDFFLNSSSYSYTFNNIKLLVLNKRDFEFMKNTLGTKFNSILDIKNTILKT